MTRWRVQRGAAQGASRRCVRTPVLGLGHAWQASLQPTQHPEGQKRDGAGTQQTLYDGARTFTV